jgi:hypothetical protein
MPHGTMDRYAADLARQHTGHVRVPGVRGSTELAWRCGRTASAGLGVPPWPYRATDRVISYRPTPPGVANGGLGEVGAWEALAPRGRTGAYKLTLGDPITRPLVERAREVSILQDVLARLLQDRQPQLLTVVSEPGLGKTRLVAELGRLVDQAPEPVTWRAGRTPPYGGVRSARSRGSSKPMWASWTPTRPRRAGQTRAGGGSPHR